MIEGIKFKLKGSEIQEMMRSKASELKKRAKAHKAVSETNDPFQMDGEQSIADKNASESEYLMAEAKRTEFLADHLDLDEDYLIDRYELFDLGL